MANLRILVALAIFLAVSHSLVAQVTTGTIYGRVLDPTGALVPAARVTAKNEQTSLTKSTETNERGEFTLAFLPVGAYTVTVQASGFKLYRATRVELSAGQKLDLTYTLELGVATETVSVTTEAPLVNTSTTQQDLRLNTMQVRELPMSRRDITSLLNLGEGVSAGGTTISINGLAPRGFTFTIDGVDASPDSEFPSLSLYGDYNYVKGVSVDAVQEVEIAKNIFSAEIAQTVSGNVNLITKGGTNEFHGSMFEYYQAGGLNAVNHLTSQKTSSVYHQFGGSLGGPIAKDKLFFFGAFEGYRLQQNSPLTGNVPSRQIREQIIRVLPQAKPYFDQWQLPSETEKPGDVVAFFGGNGKEERYDDHGNLRIDYNLSPNNHLIARYTRGHPYRIYPRTLMLSNWRSFDGLNENVAATFTRVWNPRLTSETRFGYNRSNTDRSDGGYKLGIVTLTGAGLPSIDAEAYLKWGTVTSFEHSFAQMRGAHSLKFGGSIRWHRAHRINEEIPIYSFATLADILANKPSSARYVFLLKDFLLRRWQGGVFVQDDLRLRPNLMVNLGIRYDYDAVPTESDGRIFNRVGPYGPYRPPDSPWDAYYAMVSPRAGLAWALDRDKKTSLRAGVGIFFIPHNIFEGPVELVLNGPYEPYEIASVSGVVLERLGIRYPTTNAQASPLVKTAKILGDSGLDPNWENSYSLQWNLSLQRQLTRTMSWEVGYVGTRGVKLTYSPLWNRVDVLTGLRENPDFEGFRYYQSADSSVYHALQTSFKRRFSHNLLFNAYYTYASNLAYYQGDYGCCGEGNGPQDLARLDLNRGPTSYHIRHRFISDFLYELPLKSLAGGRAAQHLLGGWQIGGILDTGTGGPLGIVQSVSNTPWARPDFAGGKLRDAVRSDWKTPIQPGGYYQYLKPEFFPQVPLGRFGTTLRPGNLGRNQIEGPGMFRTDLALSKNFRFAESRRLQFRADLFNAFNQTCLSGIDTNTRSSRFGRVTSVRAGRVTQLSVRFGF